MISLIDTHAHLDMLAADSLPAIVERANVAGVARIITVGSSLEGSRRAVDLAAEYDIVFAAVGLHPHDASDWHSAGPELEILARKGKVVAIGETGLDYHYPEPVPEDQLEAFQGQLELAEKTGLPLLVHCRDAYNEMLRIMSQWTPRLGSVVIHCFSGSVGQAKEFLDMGCYISFAGQITFKNRGVLEDVAAAVPLERMLLETDCPYLSPHPKRGTQNEPANIVLTARAVADIKRMALDDVAAATTRNARELFGI